jgi:opacity protein-like surface antigen
MKGKVMGRAKTLALAGAAALMSTASLAADVTLPRPMRAPIPVPVVAGGWYLRGYIGSSNEFLKEITHPDFLTAPAFGFLDKGGFDAAPFGGGGIGYQWNNWFRVDATLEYRGFAQFHALDRFFNPFQGFDQFGNPNPGRWNTNQYTASKSELVGLVNAFVDLGTWWCITPYIGAGAGFAQIKIDHFRDVNVMQGAGGWTERDQDQFRLGPARGPRLQGDGTIRNRAWIPVSERGEWGERDPSQPRPDRLAQYLCPGHLPQHPVARHHPRHALDAAAGAAADPVRAQRLSEITKAFMDGAGCSRAVSFSAGRSDEVGRRRRDLADLQDHSWTEKGQRGQQPATQSARRAALEAVLDIFETVHRE